jgi:hypothetical protein
MGRETRAQLTETEIQLLHRGAGAGSRIDKN